MKYSGIFVAVATALLLAACGGTKVLKEAQPFQTTQPLAAMSDQRVTATLDWVIVRDGPGTWAKNADWDEYLIRVRNLSDQPIQVTRLTVVDSLNTRIESQSDRRHLVKGSKRTASRYKKSGIKVNAGRGAGTMLVAGAAVTAIGVAGMEAVAIGSIMSGATTAGSAGTAVGGLVLLGPALVVGGIVRSANNSAVNKKILHRQTEFPLQIPASEELTLDVFFPLAPSPEKIEVMYLDASGENRLIINTHTALYGLHTAAPMDE